MDLAIQILCFTGLTNNVTSSKIDIHIIVDIIAVILSLLEDNIQYSASKTRENNDIK